MIQPPTAQVALLSDLCGREGRQSVREIYGKFLSDLCGREVKNTIDALNATFLSDLCGREEATRGS